MKTQVLQRVRPCAPNQRTGAGAAGALCLAAVLVSACLVQQAWGQMRPPSPGEISGGQVSKAAVSAPESPRAAAAEAKGDSGASGKAGRGYEGENVMEIEAVGPCSAEELSSRKASTDAVTTGGGSTPPSLASEGWSVSAFVSDFNGITDTDFDNFYDDFTYTIGIDAHPIRTPPRGPQPSVRAFFFSPLLGFMWISVSSWIPTQDDSDIQFFQATRTNFTGLLKGNTVLDLRVMIVLESNASAFLSSPNPAMILAEDDNLFGPTIMLDANEIPGYDPKVRPMSVETSGTKTANGMMSPASGGGAAPGDSPDKGKGVGEPGYGF